MGHEISAVGGVNPTKIVVVQDWPRLTTVSEVRSFFGLVGYYHRFVEGFANLSTPLTQLTRKGIKFIWSEACHSGL